MRSSARQCREHQRCRPNVSLGSLRPADWRARPSAGTAIAPVSRQRRVGGSSPRWLVPTSAAAARCGFTLVELLVTITIIAILAGIGLGSLYMAQESARAERTRTLITKLHNQMMVRWESYAVRRVPLTLTAGETPQQFAWRLLWARRELMRFELPDRYSDIWNFDTMPPAIRDPVFLVGGSGPLQPHHVYLRRIAQMLGSADANGFPLAADMSLISEQNSSAECLYLIMTMGLEVDSSGRKIFDERNVGDTDADGIPEFVDAWGEPIRWIRWPAGFVSDLQPRVPDLEDLIPTADFTRAPDVNHDSFDPRNIDDAWDEQSQSVIDKTGWVPDAPQGWPFFSPKPTDTELPDPINAPAERGFRLYPLIYSGGPDRASGIYHFTGEDPMTNATPPQNADPYAYYTASDESPPVARQRGEPIPGDVLPQIDPAQAGGGHLDNIHNHFLVGR